MVKSFRSPGAGKQREDTTMNCVDKMHTKKKGREKMVVKIPDPIPRTRPSGEPTSLPTIPSGESSKTYALVGLRGVEVKVTCTIEWYGIEIFVKCS